MKIRKLIWDEWNIEHIKKHKVSAVEVEESIFHLIAHKHSYKGQCCGSQRRRQKSEKYCL